MSTVISQAACTPNISPAARRRRIRLGIFGTVGVLTVTAVFIGFGLPWHWRALGVFVPAVVAAAGCLQAHRNTCIARAHEGTFENDDATTTKMPDADVRASRRVAAGIRRDVLIVSVVSAALAAATALLPGMP